MKLLIFGTTGEEQKTITEINRSVRLESISFAGGTFSCGRREELRGFDAIWIMTNSCIGEDEAAVLQEMGIRFVISRAAGTDHLDKNALRKHGIRAANVPSYSPNAISEHTVLLLLSALRHLRKSEEMIAKRDFGISGLCGREVRNMTIGVIGAGKIGSLTVKALNGFGAQILIHAPHENPELMKFAEYVPMEEIFERSDAIVLHCPLTRDNYHLICAGTLEKCREGVVLVNTARGGLVDGKSVLEALKTGKVSSFAMDVYESEDDFVRMDFEGMPVGDEIFEELLERKDVIYTSHIGFLTDRALYEILRISLENAAEYEKTGECRNEVVM